MISRQYLKYILKRVLSREFREYEGQEEERASSYIFSRIAASYMASLKMGSVICGKSDKYSKNQKKGIREPPVQD